MQVWIEPPPEAELGPDHMRDAASAFPGLNRCTGNNRDTTVAFSADLNFLVTRPEQNVERFLKQAEDKLNMLDAVRLYTASD